MSKTKNQKAQMDHAFALYMHNTTQSDIAEKVGVTRQTVSKWIADNSWAERRAAKNITRPQLVNRLLVAIDKQIEKLNEKNEDDKDSKNNTAGMIDQLSKLAATIKNLDKKTTVVDAIEVFIAFGKWLQYRASIDPELTPELIKAINRYQDLYIGELLGDKLKR